MHAYIITGGNRQSRIKEINRLNNEMEVNHFDELSLGNDGNSLSIGITEVRDFQRLLTLAPTAGKTRLGVVNFAETLTLEAQQAFLKTLEEPAPHAKIILETQIIDSLLPTIISRCQVISLPPAKIDEKALLLCFKTLEQIRQSPPAERLRLIEGVAKTREEAAAWVGLAIAVTHEILLSSFGLSAIKPLDKALGRQFNLPVPQAGNLTISSTGLLRRLLAALRQLDANVNPRLVLDNIFI